MPFLIKIFVFNCFCQYRLAKEVEFGYQTFCAPKQQLLSFLGCIRHWCQRISPSVSCVSLCVHGIKWEYITLKSHMSPNSGNLMSCFTQSKLSGTMVSRLNMCSQISLSRIKHKMCSNNPFSQRNKVTKRAVGWRLVGGLGKIWKRRLGYIGVLREVIREIRNPLPTMTFIDNFT